MIAKAARVVLSISTSVEWVYLWHVMVPCDQPTAQLVEALLALQLRHHYPLQVQQQVQQQLQQQVHQQKAQDGMLLL